jgi:hypothetical protein
VEGDPELTCPRVIDAVRLPPGTSASANQNILLLKRKRKLACAPLAPFECTYFFPSLFL